MTWDYPPHQEVGPEVPNPTPTPPPNPNPNPPKKDGPTSPQPNPNPNAPKNHAHPPLAALAPPSPPRSDGQLGTNSGAQKKGTTHAVLDRFQGKGTQPEKYHLRILRMVAHPLRTK